MDVLGNLSLDGLLQVSSLNGYNPNNGDMFTIITFDERGRTNTHVVIIRHLSVRILSYPEHRSISVAG